MAFDFSSLLATLDKVVADATGYVDLADKWADAAAGFVETLPAVGPDVTVVIALLDQVTAALNALNAELNPS